MKTPSEIYPPFKVDVPMTDDETAFEDIEDDETPGSSNDPHPSTPKSLNGMLMSGSCHLDRASNVEIGVECQIFVTVIFFNCSQVLQFAGHSR